MTIAWPGIIHRPLVGWFLIATAIVHLFSALAGPKLPWWWAALPLGIAELVLGVWSGALMGALAGDTGNSGRSHVRDPVRSQPATSAVRWDVAITSAVIPAS